MTHSFVRRLECPACGSAAVQTVYSSRFEEEPIRGLIEEYYDLDIARLDAAPYELARCESCTLLFQSWIGDDALLGELYGKWIKTGVSPAADPQYKQALAGVRRSRDGHEIMAAAAHLDIRPSDMTTLDYGMGWALWGRIARALGCRSYGTDLAPSRMRFAAEHGITTLADEDIGKFRFHFINTEQVFEHLARPGELARMLVDALAPGGILKISVPAGDGVDRIVAALARGDRLSNDALMPVHPLEHINCFNRRSLRSLAARLGLRVVVPRLRHRYAFLGQRGTLDFRSPKTAAKELVRPIYQFNNSKNIYCWLQKTS